jgi:predicted acylesterase/phospholipase RssA
MIKRVLVLSGGGCKGYIQVQVLKKLEENYGPLHEFYDLVCGSSVGAINGSMIASGKITMEKLESIYVPMIQKVFKRRIGIPFYDRKNFLDVWNNEIGMIKMKDCKTKLQITSVNLCDKRNHFFKSWTKDGEQYLVSEVIKSFSAPLFFGSFIDSVNQCVWLDGGMGVANIPIAYALVESQLLWPNDNWFFEIIGCGFNNEDIPFNEAKKFKFVRQLAQYFNIEDAGLAREQVRQEQLGAIQQLSNSSSKISFRYWDTIIPKKIDKLDGVKYLSEYKVLGQEMAKNPLLKS